MVLLCWRPIYTTNEGQWTQLTDSQVTTSKDEGHNISVLTPDFLVNYAGEINAFEPFVSK